MALRCRNGRRGQSGVETMLLAALIAIMLVAMFHLFQVTWATQNAHIRAREATFHGKEYLKDYAPREDYVEVLDSDIYHWDVDRKNYALSGYQFSRNGTASNAPVGVDLLYDFNASAQDATRADSFEQQQIEVTATITNVGTP